MEIRKKFLIKDVNNLNLGKYYHKTIIQNYLYVNKFTAIIKRKISDNNINKYTYTIKTFKVWISVNEIEKDISEEEYNNLSLNYNYNRFLTYFNKYNIYLNKYIGIIFAVIEFSSGDSACKIKLPNWFGPELSFKITNFKMATSLVNKIFDFLKNF